jgi:hypothetical protein
MGTNQQTEETAMKAYIDGASPGIGIMNPYTKENNNLAALPKDKKATTFLWDSYGFALAAIFLITSYYWVPSTGIASHVFVAITTIALAFGTVTLSLKSMTIEETKFSYGGLAIGIFLIIYMVFTLVLGAIVSSALSGLDFSF